jgi:hypothetical protein
MTPKPFEISIQTSFATSNGSNHDQMNPKKCQMITKIATLIICLCGASLMPC